MKVLVTGGAGFIGSHLVDRLLTRNDRVLVIDNYTTGRRDTLTPHPNLTVVEGSITDRDLVDRVFGDFAPERVVHAAASYKDPDDWSATAPTSHAMPRPTHAVSAAPNTPSTVWRPGSRSALRTWRPMPSKPRRQPGLPRGRP